MRKLFKVESKKNQAGQVLVLAIVVVGLVLINTLIIIGGSQIFFQNAHYSLTSDQALNLAEAGVDKAITSLNKTGGNYVGETETMIGPGSFSVVVTSPNPNTKIIESTGYIPSKTNPKAKRTIKINASKGIGVSFNYGLQVGEGGLKMGNLSRINGSVYSNGSVEMSNGSMVTGDVYVAGGTAALADQESDCTSPSCSDYIFGKNVGGENRLDVAQSFMPSTKKSLNKVSLKLKKNGSPSDIVVRILGDTNNKPDRTKVKASGNLTANLVSDQYAFVDVTFSATPVLEGGERYWIMVAANNLDNQNYWYWSADTLQGYTQGTAVFSPNWQAQNPSWTPINADLGFKTFMGGEITFIRGGENTEISGNAYANTLQDLNVGNGAYYQTKISVTAQSYYPNSPDPAPKALPISDANIQFWKNAAESLALYTGDITSCRSSLGPGKYIGNITFGNNCNTVISDPIWITGELNIGNGDTFRLNSSYGNSSGVIVVGGKVTLGNNSRLQGSGTAGSYLMLISAYDSRVNNEKAMEIGNGGNEGVMYVPYGIVDLGNTNRLNQLSAWKIDLSNSATVDYETGLASLFFSSGPSGGFSLVKGTYQIK